MFILVMRKNGYNHCLRKLKELGWEAVVISPLPVELSSCGRVVFMEIGRKIILDLV